MTNKYIKIEMKPTWDNTGGTFETYAKFKLDNIPSAQSGIKIIIDTGCSISTITASKLLLDEADRKELKLADIRNHIIPKISYGVETGGERHKEPDPDDENEMLECTALKFPHRISDFEIDGVPINTKYIHVNYDRKSNILIGMDILKDWDIHMGKVIIPNLKETGKTIFLACPLDGINQEYLLELERLFKVGTAINSILAG